MKLYLLLARVKPAQISIARKEIDMKKQILIKRLAAFMAFVMIVLAVPYNGLAVAASELTGETESSTEALTEALTESFDATLTETESESFLGTLPEDGMPAPTEIFTELVTEVETELALETMTQEAVSIPEIHTEVPETETESLTEAAPEAEEYNNYFTVYGQKAQYLESFTGDRTSIPGYDYTEDGFHMTPADWTTSTPFGTLQTKNKVNLKDGVYMAVRVDNFTYANDKWYNFNIWNSQNLSPGVVDLEKIGEGVQTLMRPANPAEGAFAGDLKTIAWYTGGFTSAGSVSFPTDAVMTDENGLHVLILEITWDGASYAVNINGAAAPEKVITYMNETFADGEAYVGFTLQNSNKGGTLECTVLRFGTSEETAVVPTGDETVAPINYVISYAEIADPSTVAKNEPAIFMTGDVEASDAQQVPYTSSGTVVTRNGDGSMHVVINREIAETCTYKVAYDVSYSIDDFPVAVMLTRNFCSCKTSVCLGTECVSMYLMTGDIINPSSTYKQNNIVARDSIVSGGDAYGYFLFDMSSSAAAWDAEGRINGVRFDVVQPLYADTTKNEFDVCFTAFFRSVEEADAFIYSYLGTEKTVDEKEEYFNVYINTSNLYAAANRNASMFGGIEVLDSGERFVRFYNNAEKYESFFNVYTGGTKVSGKYVVLKYRLPSTNTAKTPIDFFTGTVASAPTGSGDYRQIAASYLIADDQWQLLVLDASTLSAYTANEVGEYVAKYLRIDVFNGNIGSGNYIDVQYMAICDSLESIALMNKDIAEVTFVGNTVEVVETEQWLPKIPAVSLVAQSSKAYSGCDISFTINIADNQGFGGLVLKIEPEAGLNWTFKSIEFAEGIVGDVGSNIVLYPTDENTAYTADGVLATVTYTVADDIVSDTYDIAISVKDAADINGNEITVNGSSIDLVARIRAKYFFTVVVNNRSIGGTDILGTMANISADANGHVILRSGAFATAGGVAQYRYSTDNGETWHDLDMSQVVDCTRTDIKNYIASNHPYWVDTGYETEAQFNGLTIDLSAYHDETVTILVSAVANSGAEYTFLKLVDVYVGHEHYSDGVYVDNGDGTHYATCRFDGCGEKIAIGNHVKGSATYNGTDKLYHFDCSVCGAKEVDVSSFNFYADAEELAEIVNTRGQNFRDVTLAEDKSSVKLYMDSRIPESYVVPFAGINFETGKYVVIKYKTNYTNIWEFWSSTVNAAPCATDRVGGFKPVDDECWNLMIVDLTNSRTFTANDAGEYYARYLRFDVFNGACVEDQYVELGFMAVCEDLEAISNYLSENKDVACSHIDDGIWTRADDEVGMLQTHCVLCGAGLSKKACEHSDLTKLTDITAIDGNFYAYMATCEVCGLHDEITSINQEGLKLFTPDDIIAAGSINSSAANSGGAYTWAMVDDPSVVPHVHFEVTAQTTSEMYFHFNNSSLGRIYNVGNYFAIAYRTSISYNHVEMIMRDTSGSPGFVFGNKTLVNDHEWHIAIFDYSSSSTWTTETGLDFVRFDLFNAPNLSAGTFMDVAYAGFFNSFDAAYDYYGRYIEAFGMKSDFKVQFDAISCVVDGTTFDFTADNSGINTPMYADLKDVAIESATSVSLGGWCVTPGGVREYAYRVIDESDAESELKHWLVGGNCALDGGIGLATASLNYGADRGIGAGFQGKHIVDLTGYEGQTVSVKIYAVTNYGGVENIAKLCNITVPVEGFVKKWDISATDADNVIAELHEDPDHEGYYTLVISGSGMMDDYATETYWYDYKDAIRSVVIEDGVSLVGAYAFANCSAIEFVDIADSVYMIGKFAFVGCTNLKSILLQNNIAVVEANAFENCSNLIIYCQAFSKPDAWHVAWNPNNRPVVWAYGHTHTAGEWVVDIPATCTTGGQSKLLCAECDAVMQYRADKALDHSFANDACERCGLKKFTLTVKYVYENGEVAATAYTTKLISGASYNVTSPVLDGYTVDKAAVSGVLTSNTLITVTYKKVALVEIVSLTKVLLGDVSYNTPYKSLGLPSTVNGITADGSVVALRVSWTSSDYSPTTYGFQIIRGKVIASYGYTFAMTPETCATLTISENVITSVKPMDIGKLPLGTSYAGLGLPSTAAVTTSTGAVHYVPVSWNAYDYDSSVAGEHTIYGALTLPEGFAFASGVENKAAITFELSEVMYGTADIVFLIDTTGSMYGEIQNVKNNINTFAQNLENAGVSARWALLEYRDITCDGKNSTKVIYCGSSEWYIDVDAYKSAIASLKVSGGGDREETVIDALKAAMLLEEREDAHTFYVVVTDADYKVANNYGVESMAEMIKELQNSAIVTSVVTKKTYYGVYNALVDETGGILANIDGNFAEELYKLKDMIATTVIYGNVVSIEVTKAPDKLAYYQGDYFDGSGMEITATYESGLKSVVTGYSVDPAGALNTADTSVTVNYRGKSATVKVSVAPAVYPVTGISVNPTAITLEEGQTRSVTVTVYPSNASNKEVIYTTTNPNVAVLENGVITAIGEGSAALTITTLDGGFTATVSVTVTAKPVEIEGIYADFGALELLTGKSETVKIHVLPEEAELPELIWSTSDKNVFTIYEGGQVYATGMGEATLTVTTADGLHSLKILVKVTCGHSLVSCARVEPTCSKTGMEAFWYCKDCGAMFSDFEGKNSVIKSDLVLEIVDHVYEDGFCIWCGAAEVVADPMIVTVIGGTAKAGEEVSVVLDISNNPGIACLVMTLTYDTEALELLGVENGSIMSDFDNDINFLWSASQNVTAEGTLLTMKFRVKEEVEDGEYAVDLIFRECYDLELNDVPTEIVGGHVTVKNFIYGDANDDGLINGKDVVLVRRYIAGYDYDTGISSVTVGRGADTNGDGTVNGKDVVLLRKYIASYDYDTGMSTVVLGPKK